MSKENMLDGWKKVRLGDAYRFTRKPRDLKYGDFATIPFVPMEYVPLDSIYVDNFISKTPAELTNGTYFEKGDVLIAKITPSFENGKQGIVEDIPTPFGIASTEVIPISSIDGLSDKLYLFFYLLEKNLRSELASKMEGSTGRQRLNKSTLEKFDNSTTAASRTTRDCAGVANGARSERSAAT